MGALRSDYRYLIAALLVSAAVWLFTAVHDNRYLLSAALDKGPITTSFKVSEVTVRENEKGMLVRARGRVEGCSVEAAVPLESLSALPEVGETWSFTGWPGRTRGYTRRLWVRGRGTGAHREAEAPLWGIEGFLAQRRQDLSRRVGLGLEPPWADLSRAILLGERKRMDAASLETFRLAGSMHLFAISGLHVMVIAGFLVFLLQLTGLNRRLVYALVVPLLWGYVLMIGLPASAVRAALMASFYFLAPVVGRRSNALVSWSLALILSTLASPWQVGAVGNVLSFAVMLSLILMEHYLRAFTSRRWDILAYSFAAWAAGVPIVAAVFGRFTPGGLFANLVLIPLTSLEVVLGVTGLALSFVSTALAAFVNASGGLLLQLMYAISWGIARVPGASVACPQAGFRFGLIWYVCLFALLGGVRLLHARYVIWSLRRSTFS